MSNSNKRQLCVNKLRHAEYYGMQNQLDALYQKSRNGECFDNLVPLIVSRNNILMAYRNIKANTGSKTAGTDKLTIEDIEKLNPEEVEEKVKKILLGNHGYRPKPVRRKDIPKQNGSTRPLGIPCIWDRLIQQCILQIVEPICEAKFSNNSYGFRPNRSAENAIRAIYNRIQFQQLHYVVEVDIKGFFDNVNHSKLIKQIWNMGIRDKHLIYIIKQILKAPIKMPNGTIMYPDKGTPQGGIISPLLANIVLNELDRWVESQWQSNPVAQKYQIDRGPKGLDCSNGYRALKKTKMKEMWITRYADDFRIFCRTKTDAEKTKIATIEWLKKRLKLDVSQEKTRVVNINRRYSEFLGFKIKSIPRRNKRVVKSHVSDKQLIRIKRQLAKQAECIANPNNEGDRLNRVRKYNSMVLGIQNYYGMATLISEDFRKIHFEITKILKNRLTKQHECSLTKTGRHLTKKEQGRYGQSARMRYIANGEPIYPIGHVQYQNPYQIKTGATPYTESGRNALHKNLCVNYAIMEALANQKLWDKSTEYMDNRISLFSAQMGKCSVTGKEFLSVDEIHCHHKTPVEMQGTDKYENLTLVLKDVHKLIHATSAKVIQKYLELLSLNAEQLRKLNALRQKAGLEIIQ